MAQGKTPWLTYGLVAAGAFGLWWWWKNNQPAATPANVPVSPPLPAPGGQVINDQVMAPVPSQQIPVATVMPAIAAGITQPMWQAVQSWAQEDGRAPVLQMAAAQVPSEYAGMYDLITNYWDKNVPPGPAQVTFWNNLRAKYDPGPPPDQTW